MRIERVDPRDLDLDTADAIAEVLNASRAGDGLDLPLVTGAGALLARQLQSDSRPVDAVLLAWDGDRLVGEGQAVLPWRENLEKAHVRVDVRPDARRQGVGRALLDAALEVAREGGRSRVTAGAYVGTPGVDVLGRWGFEPTGVNAVRRLDLHVLPASLGQELLDEAAPHAEGYELVRQVGTTPPDRRAGMAALHEAINDAPHTDDATEDDLWDEQRLADYEGAMAGRRQTLYRVLVRHRDSGDWAGQSLVCVDELAPSAAFQEDTVVVRAHRGHRLGLLMKADMLRWLADERPEVAQVDTWNDTTNHHMIAINERLGAHVVARHQGFRRAL